MRALVFSTALAVALGFTTACKKPDSGPGPAAPVSDASTDPAGAVPSPRGPGPMPPAPATVVVVADTGDINATLSQLSLELRKYVARNRKVPKTFEEFLAQSNVQPPPAPAGKKYAIQDQAIVLVKR